MLAISFKLLAMEYIFKKTIAELLNNSENLSADFWGFNATDFSNFEFFCKKATAKLESLLPKTIDERKRNMFSFIYDKKGEINVKEVTEQACWSRQQINRYFNKQFGLSVKAYYNILRFRASFQHIKEVKLFPENSFSDQSRFIREVKKLSDLSINAFRSSSI